MTQQKNKPSVFHYLDFRKYLQDAFAFEKTRDSSLSYLSFSKAAGYTSPNLLQFIIQGSRKLTGAKVLGTARALKLKKQETEFFELLVAFGQARTHDERDHFFRKILRHPKYAVHKTISRAQYRYFDKWYYPVIRELVTCEACNGDANWIARRIFPRITVAQVASAVALLEELKLIRKENGTWRQTESVIQTPGEVTNVVASTYHKTMLELAGGAIDAFGPDARDLRAVTLKLSRSQYLALKEKINGYWKEVLSFAAVEEESEEVYQVNFQLFPLTKKGKARS